MDVLSIGMDGMKQTIKSYEARHERLERKLRSEETKVSVTSTISLTVASITVVFRGMSIGVTIIPQDLLQYV